MALSKRSLLESIYDNLARLEQKLDASNTTIQAGIAMANAALATLITQLNDETNLIQARIDRLISDLQNVATPEQLADLTAISSRLSVLGQDPANPIP